jgi:hypothetical protein
VVQLLFIHITSLSGLEVGGKNLNKQQVEDAVERYSDLIDRSKDQQAYSDYKEGINEGLEIAKDTFDEYAEKFDLSDSNEDRATKIKSLQDRFEQLIDTLSIRKKPKYSQDSLDGINEGLKRSKELFRDFIEEFL